MIPVIEIQPRPAMTISVLALRHSSPSTYHKKIEPRDINGMKGSIINASLLDKDDKNLCCVALCCAVSCALCIMANIAQRE